MKQLSNTDKLKMATPLEWALGLASDSLLKYLGNKIFSKDLVSKLEKEVEKWSKELPPEVQFHHEALFHNIITDSDLKEFPKLFKLRNELKQYRIPDTATWFEALFERWQYASSINLPEETHPFFKQLPEEARQQLQILAQRLAVICKKDEELARVTTIDKIDEMQESVNRLGEYIIWKETTIASRKLDKLSEYYFNWVSRTTETFTVLGLGVALPITQAWVKLSAFNIEKEETPSKIKKLEQVIAKYHEWEKLADRSINDTFKDAEHVAAFNKRVVIVGGPGAGKSTLLKRLAHKYSNLGKTVLNVRLPLVAQYIEKAGDIFEDALIKVAGDGSGIAYSELKTLFASPSYLLADGLDECDHFRINIANLLKRWAHGHEQTSIIVTTRPVGHEPGLFHGWKHYELLPLSKSNAEGYAGQVFAQCFKNDNKKVQEELNNFKKYLETNYVASVASRNPLLLGFIIQLSLNRIQFGRKRSALYNEIINLIQHTPSQDRSYRVNMEHIVASRFLDIFGWLLHEDPAIPISLLIQKGGDLIVSELNEQALEARRQAEQAFNYWEERRVLERLTIGTHEVVTFIHLALGEFAAGRYASKLSDPQLNEWITKVRRENKWREVILFAASTGDEERVIKTLVSLDDAKDPTSTEILLAVSAYLEAGTIHLGLAEDIIKSLIPRLLSNIPIIAYEAGSAALTMTNIVPDIIGPEVKRLVIHEQPWTQKIAWALVVSCGKKYVNFDLLEQNYEALIEPQVTTAPGTGIMILTGDRYSLNHALIVKGAELLLSERRTQDVIEKIDRVINKRCLSIGITNDLTKVLVEKGLQDIVQNYYEHVMSCFEWLNEEKWEQWKQSSYEAEKALLEAIISAFPDIDAKSKEVFTEGFLCLSALFYSMRFNEVGYSNYVVLKHRKDIRSLETAIQGAVAALQLDPQKLVAEAKYGIEQIKPEYDKDLLSMLIKVDVTPIWSRAKNANLDIHILAQALNHPSDAIAITAAELLHAGVGGDEAAVAMKKTLQTGGSQALRMISAIAFEIWGEKAIDIFLERLEGELNQGCEYLFESLPNLINGQANDRVFKCLLKGIMTPSPRIAEAAAKSMGSIDIPYDYADDILKAIDYWKTHEPTYSDKRGVVQPNPIAHLLRAFTKVGKLTTQKLLEFYSDVRHDVREVAAKALVDTVKTDKDELTELLKNISTSNAPIGLLKNLLELPDDILQSVKEVIIFYLLKSPNDHVRSITATTLGGSWIDEAEAAKLAREVLQDKTPSVRDQAVRVLRQIMYQQMKEDQEVPRKRVMG
jgi:energy-coupling factor transporter ATP-binding protein EcfA2